MSIRVEPKGQNAFIDHDSLHNQRRELSSNCRPYQMFTVCLRKHKPYKRDHKGNNDTFNFGLGNGVLAGGIMKVESAQGNPTCKERQIVQIVIFIKPIRAIDKFRIMIFPIDHLIDKIKPRNACEDKQDRECPWRSFQQSLLHFLYLLIHHHRQLFSPFVIRTKIILHGSIHSLEFIVYLFVAQCEHCLSIYLLMISLKFINLSKLQLKQISMFMSFNQIFIMFACCFIMINGQLKPERVVIVDRNTKLKNYFVRGNLPIQNNQFQIQQLKTRLTEVTGLKKYKLIIISMLNFLTPKQTKNRYIQQTFFQQHPNQGQYRHKLILGSLIDPFSIPSALRPVVTSFNQYLADIDQIDEFISSIHGEINEGEGKKIVYLHCAAGMDRTGYVAGSYKLKYLQESLNKILEENSKFGGNRTEMHFNALNGLKWSCLKYKNEKQCQRKTQ